MRTNLKEFERERRIAHLEIAIKQKHHDILVLKMFKNYDVNFIKKALIAIEDLESQLVDILLLEGDEVED